jgi:peptide deformylase
MIRDIVRYGSPVLRQKGARIERITPEIRQLVSDMFDTMYAAHGVGLAAQQVGEALQLTVLDIRGVEERPSTLLLNGQPSDPEAFMPLVLVNPEVRAVGDPVSGPEGCLSFPEVYAEVERPESVDVQAADLEGRPIRFRCGGLLAKAVQHEVDHLNGVLFIDRMARAAKAGVQEELDLIMADTKAVLEGAKVSAPAKRERRRRRE